jgi:hypothetical protein
MMGLNAVDSMGPAVGSFLGVLLGRPGLALANLQPHALGGVENVEIRERI